MTAGCGTLGGEGEENAWTTSGPASPLFVASWLIPIAVLVYLLRALNTVILGIRSINAAAQRTADALERIEMRGGGLP